VRNKIKMFAQKKVTLPPGRHKIVILDEADRSVLNISSLFNSKLALLLYSCFPWFLLLSFSFVLT
jgi:hypothetical protein